MPWCLFRSLLVDERGATFVRYSSLTLLLAIAAIALLAKPGNERASLSHARNATIVGN
jgi:Flp pilus assembly pilin Flp